MSHQFGKVMVSISRMNLNNQTVKIMSLSLWHDAASLSEADRAEMVLPVCLITGTALRSLSNVALSSAPVKLFYNTPSSASKGAARQIMGRVGSGSVSGGQTFGVSPENRQRICLIRLSRM